MTYRDHTERLLRAMPGTLSEIAARTGMSKSTVKRWCSAMRTMGWVHVPRWRRPDGPGKTQPVLHPGPGRNAPCPPALPASHYQAKCRAGAKKDGRHEFQLAKRRALTHARKVQQRGVKATPFDTLFK